MRIGLEEMVRMIGGMTRQEDGAWGSMVVKVYGEFVSENDVWSCLVVFVTNVKKVGPRYSKL